MNKGPATVRETTWLLSPKPGPLACARVIGGFTYEVTFVHLPGGRGGLTCTRHGDAARGLMA